MNISNINENKNVNGLLTVPQSSQRMCVCVCVCVCVCILSYPAFKAHAPYYVLSTLACLAVQYSSTFSHKRRDFLEKKILLNTKYLV